MRLKTERQSLILALSAALALAACDDKSAAQQQAPGQGAPPPVEVGVVTIQPQTVPLSTELPGRTTAYRVAEVRPQVSGIVLKRLFEEGSEVKAGQQLYQIDPATYQAAVQSAEADLNKARATLESIQAKAARYGDLVKLNAVSRQDYDDTKASLAQARAQIQVAQAAVDTANISLGYTKVYAPISGRIGKSLVTEGALVTANQASPLATITQLDPIYVDVNQSSSDMLRLREALASGKLKGGATEGTPVSLTLDGSPTPYEWQGELKFSDVTVDPSTGAVQLRAVFPNPEQALLPGLFVRARVQQGVKENALLVPQKAVVRTPDGKAAVWVVGADGAVAQKPIATVRAVGDAWLIDGGVEAGQSVVVTGLQKIRQGAIVKPVPDGAPAAPGATPGGAAPGGAAPAKQG